MWPGLQKLTIWVQITLSYIFTNIFYLQRSILFPEAVKKPIKFCSSDEFFAVV